MTWSMIFSHILFLYLTSFLMLLTWFCLPTCLSTSSLGPSALTLYVYSTERMTPLMHIFECLVPSWWNYSGWIKSCSLFVAVVTHEMGFKVSKATQFSVSSVCPTLVDQSQLLATSVPCMPAYCHNLHHQVRDSNSLIRWVSN